jgi:hypothetical protein
VSKSSLIRPRRFGFLYRQADDKTLENYAMRIRSRAIQRAGELLKEFDGRPGKRR